MPAECVIVNVWEGVATVALNRSEVLNALDVPSGRRWPLPSGLGEGLARFGRVA